MSYISLYCEWTLSTIYPRQGTCTGQCRTMKKGMSPHAPAQAFHYLDHSRCLKVDMIWTWRFYISITLLTVIWDHLLWGPQQWSAQYSPGLYWYHCFVPFMLCLLADVCYPGGYEHTNSIFNLKKQGKKKTEQPCSYKTPKPSSLYGFMAKILISITKNIAHLQNGKFSGNSTTLPCPITCL